MQLWPHQVHAISEIANAILAGRSKILVTTPTGGGKTRVIAELFDHYCGQYGWAGVCYTNRRLLIEQLSDRMAKSGISHGVRAAGHDDERDCLVQISSIPTEANRTLKSKTWTIHGDDRQGECLVVIDEAHLNAAETAEEIVEQHLKRGHKIIGFTATPEGLGHFYEFLIRAGTNSELRACGAIVRADVYGPDEPDYRAFRSADETFGDKETADDLDRSQIYKMGGQAKLFGRVFDWYKFLNPNQKPALLFAPGVPESLWLAQQFVARGINAAHIDGEHVWTVSGSERTSREARAEILEQHRAGEIKVICNRFVLREGIDAPWIEHGILATIFGNLSTYLQSVGRLLRASPGKERCVIQDHGGNWHRHGSPNEDRHWPLDYSPGIAAAVRVDGYREGRIKEPARCPKCSQITHTQVCPTCGHQIDHSRLRTRPVITSDGAMVELRGDVYRKRTRVSKPDTQGKWRIIYYRARNAGRAMTFRQAEGLFFYENSYFPPRNLKLMPKEAHSWFRLVRDVPPGELL